MVHENRGLTDHIKSVAGRFATSGYSALAVDLLSAGGGTKAYTDDAEIMQKLRAADRQDLVQYMVAAVDELERVPGAKVGAIGFCFGGGMVWEFVASGEKRLAAAAPFYGTTPEDGADFTDSNAAVLGVYAELDDRVNATRETARSARVRRARARDRHLSRCEPRVLQHHGRQLQQGPGRKGLRQGPRVVRRAPRVVVLHTRRS